MGIDISKVHRAARRSGSSTGFLAVAMLFLAATLTFGCTPEAGEERAATSDDPGAGVELAVAEKEGIGRYVADGEGRSLYLFTSDAEGKSTCHDACAEAWPPLLAEGRPTAADPALDAVKIGTITRADGERQVTYAGHPLYHYVQDQKPGQIVGQDVHDSGGEWYLVTPNGETLKKTAAAARLPEAEAPS